MKTLYKRILLFTVVFSGLRLAAQATLYDNSTITSDILNFGSPNSATFGQTFIAPTDAVLDDWTLYLKTYLVPAANLNFQFDLTAWDGSKATGPVLYQSATQTLLTSQSSYEAFTVNPNVTLAPDSSYVMFINESGLNVGKNTLAAQGANSSSLLGGAFVYLNNGDTFSQVTSVPWSIGTSVNPAWKDTAYKADFSSVPEGDSTLLLLLGMGCVGMVLVRSKLRRPISVA